ncbi:MAG: PIN domain-containing protein [Gemmataceae bacterium]|nr:PIN domain-containing protein [Gemmataceae bacterium]
MIVFLDSNIVIYSVEGNPLFAPRVIARFARAQAAGDTFMISDLTRLECLVGPLKKRDAAVEANFQAFFARPDVRVVAITAAVCDRAARIRAAHNFKQMDSLQLASAVEHGADVFLTADARLSSFPDIRVEILT